MAVYRAFGDHDDNNDQRINNKQNAHISVKNKGDKNKVVVVGNAARNQNKN